MKPFLRSAYGLLPALVVVGVFGLIATGYAQIDSNNPLGTSDGATADALSCQLYQQTKALMEGQIGVLVGLILVFIGLWNLISGKGWFSAILAIVVGAAIPSVPGLVESFIGGYRELMIESGVTPSSISTSTNNSGQGGSHTTFDISQMQNCDSTPSTGGGGGADSGQAAERQDDTLDRLRN